MRVLRLLAAVALSTAVVAPLSATANSSALSNLDDHSTDPAYATWFTQEVTWSQEACVGAALGNTDDMECADIRAPRNWHNAEQGDLMLKIARHKGADTSKRLLLSNPGGPGESGLVFGSFVLPEWLGTQDTHYAVGVDPRGVGASSPLTCRAERIHSPGSYLADGEPRTHTLEGVKVAADDRAELLKACVQMNADVVAYVNSEQTARDFMLIRQLLGKRTADYYGVSYGSWLGAIMKKMFPESLDRVVLDGIADWTRPLESTFRAMDHIRQASFDQQLLPFLASQNDVYGLGDTPEQVNATAERIRASLVAAGGSMTGQQFDAFIQASLYGPTGWHSVGSFLKQQNSATAADAAAATDAAVASVPPADVREGWQGWAFGHDALACGDTANATDVETWYAETAPVAARLPLHAASTLFPRCHGWPLKPGVPDEVLSRPLGQALMVHNEADPATSYAGAVASHLAAGGATRLVAIDDMPWHGVPGRWNACARTAIDGYLVQGSFPERDVACQAGPLFSEERDRDSGAKIIHRSDVVWEFQAAGSAQSRPEPQLYASRVLEWPAVDADASSDARLHPRPGGPHVASEADRWGDRILRSAAARSLDGWGTPASRTTTKDHGPL